MKFEPSYNTPIVPPSPLKTKVEVNFHLGRHLNTATSQERHISTESPSTEPLDGD